jgi:PAS domain S-box-containing protein
VILSPEGEPLTRFTNPTGFYSLIQSTEKGKERCFRSFMEVGKIALESEEPKILCCFAHDWHFVAPIVVDGEHKGTVFAGQFIHEKLSSEQLHDLEKIALEIDLDPGLLVKEAGKLRVAGEDVIRNYSSLLFEIVEAVARSGAQAAELSRVNDVLEKAHDELERRFGDVVESMYDLVWEVDAGGKYTYCSEKVKDVLGYSADEMIGKTPFDFMVSYERGDIGADFAELIRERRPIKNVENWLRTKYGRSVCLLTNGVPILNDAGELLGYRGVDSDITERKKAEEALNDRVEFEEIVTAISTSFINLAPDEIDIGIEGALGSIGEFAGVDRSYVFRLFDDKTAMDNTHEWCASGVVPQIENLKGLRTADFPWLMAQLNRFETVHIPVVADLPPEADVTKETLQSQDILSVILVPMAYSGTLVGHIGFDSVRREKRWSEDDIALLKVVGEIFVNALEHREAVLERRKGSLERKRVMAALQESEERYRTLYDSSDDAIMMLTPEEGFFSGNPATIEMFGCKDDKEFASRTPDELSPQYQPDGKLSSEKAGEMMAIAMEKGSHFFEWTHSRMDGKEFPTTVLLTRMELQGRRVLQATVRDISELPTFVMDSKGFNVMVNEAFLNFYAVPGKDMIIGRNALTEPANVKQGVVKYFKEALKGEIVEIPEIEFVSPHNNKKLIMRSRMFPIVGPTGTLTNVVVMQEDLTEHKELELELIRLSDAFKMSIDSIVISE